MMWTVERRTPLRRPRRAAAQAATAPQRQAPLDHAGAAVRILLASGGGERRPRWRQRVACHAQARDGAAGACDAQDTGCAKRPAPSKHPTRRGPRTARSRHCARLPPSRHAGQRHRDAPTTPRAGDEAPGSSPPRSPPPAQAAPGRPASPAAGRPARAHVDRQGHPRHRGAGGSRARGDRAVGRRPCAAERGLAAAPPSGPLAPTHNGTRSAGAPASPSAHIITASR
jgi:hypothetical protein